MMIVSRFIFSFSIILLLITACSAKAPRIVVNKDYIQPGSIVKRGTQEFQLIGNPLQEGMVLPETGLIDASTMEEFTFSQIRGKVAVVSIVPSIDTRVCEAQSHYLGEAGDRLPAGVLRMTISRDTPFAQKRFAREGKLNDIQFLSDYREAAFGMATGLLVDDSRLLARGVLVINTSGRVQYMQIVSQLGELPDMEKAFDAAMELAEQP